ncbi:MAG TPA: hypothetical protein V6C78_28275, partial [Crinalium sp.]
FDLVLVDFSMPTPRYQRDVNGPELICTVKQRLSNPPLLVLISGFFTKDLLHSAADLCPEADAILSKEISVSDLISRIRDLLANANKPSSKHYHTQFSEATGAEYRMYV